MSTLLNGKIALVTGSTSGIGRAIADVLADRGVHVIVSGRSTERGAQAVAEIRKAGGKADFVQADLSSADSTRALAQQARSVTGRIDILVNNAGVFPEGATADTTEEVFDAVYNTNVKAPLFLVAELVPGMVERGGGAVVNISSFVADRAAWDRVAYSSSKAALNNLTKAWAKQYGPSGVRVNSVAPGPVLSEEIQAAAAGDPRTAAAVEHLPARRFGLPREIAEAVAYLASDDAAFVHGAFLNVDGGAVLV
ncbi:SDR family NAD(P)-dependent oxidoreductase [Streptomyces pseudoechinosporeus]